MIRLPRNRGWKAAWRLIGDTAKYYRSAWEANYARYLEYLKKNNRIRDWFHEPKRFIFSEVKRGIKSYLPDFKVYRENGTHFWVEVKGFMDSKSKTKIKRFRKYFPDETLLIVDKTWFTKNSKAISIVCDGWEHPVTIKKKKKENK